MNVLFKVKWLMEEHGKYKLNLKSAFGQLQHHKPIVESEMKTVYAKLVSLVFNFKEKQSSRKQRSL